MNSLLRVCAFLLFAAPALAQCPPVLLQCPPSPQAICDESANNALFWNNSYWWDPVHASHDLAEGQVDLRLSTIDTCQSGNTSIRFTLHLDLNADGVRETVVDSDSLPGWNTVYYGNASTGSLSGGMPRAFDFRPVLPTQKYGFVLQTTRYGDTLTACVRWNTEQAPDMFALPELPLTAGSAHEIVWTVEQGGEEKTCSYFFAVKDCKKPAVTCLNGLSVNITPTSMITLWNTDFLQYVEDNITPYQQIVLGIRKSGAGTGFPVQSNGDPQASVTFTCDELGTNLVELWARDKTGNAAYCETYVIIQDNLNHCSLEPGMSSVCVEHVCLGEPMSDVYIEVTNQSPGLPPGGIFGFGGTGTTGCWSPVGVPVLSGYTVKPHLDVNPLNGVSTFDLILINKHILNVGTFHSLWQYLAADANDSRSVTTFDIVTLRKLILGVYTELPYSESWRFFRKDFVFPNPDNPFQTLIPDTAALNDIPVDFVGVKVGDLNCNAIPNFASPGEDRATAAVALPDAGLEAGQVLETPLSVPEGVNWTGFQFALEYDPEKIELEEVEPADLPGFDGEAYARPREGLLTVSWFDLNAQGLAPGAALLRLRWRARTAVRLPEAVRLLPQQLHPEAYTTDERTQTLQLLFGKPAAPDGMVVFAPQPNPTAGAACIPVQVGQPALVQIELFDAGGRAIFQQQLDLAKGMHQLVLPTEAMPQPGVYIWRIKAGTVVQSGRIVRM